MTEHIGGDPARLVGPAFYEMYGDSQIPVACVLAVITIDPDEGNTKSTYIVADGQEPLATHYGLAAMALQRIRHQMQVAIASMDPDDDG